MRTITIFNGFTGESRRLTIDEDKRWLSVREAAIGSGLIPHDEVFHILDEFEIIADNDALYYYNDAELVVSKAGLPNIVSGGGWALYVEEIIGGFAALKILGPFTQSYFGKLGERLGDSTADFLSHIKLHRWVIINTYKMERLVITYQAAETTIILPHQMTDQARLALIDLDVTTEEIRGNTLRWDSASETWRPVLRNLFLERAKESDTGLSGPIGPRPSKGFIEFSSGYRKKRVNIHSGMTLQEAAKESGLMDPDATNFIITNSRNEILNNVPAQRFDGVGVYLFIGSHE
jgi:hypothetical protein